MSQNLVREGNNEMVQMKPMVKKDIKTSHYDTKGIFLELNTKIEVILRKGKQKVSQD